jgi:hypothetical protein
MKYCEIIFILKDKKYYNVDIGNNHVLTTKTKTKTIITIFFKDLNYLNKQKEIMNKQQIKRLYGLLV